MWSSSHSQSSTDRLIFPVIVAYLRAWQLYQYYWSLDRQAAYHDKCYRCLEEYVLWNAVSVPQTNGFKFSRSLWVFRPMPKQLHLSQWMARYLRWTVVLNAVLNAGINASDLLKEILIAQERGGRHHSGRKFCTEHTNDTLLATFIHSGILEPWTLPCVT